MGPSREAPRTKRRRWFVLVVASSLVMASATVAFATSAPAGADVVSASGAVRRRSWVQLLPRVSPTPRWDAAMAFDPAIDKMVLFGGLVEDEDQDGKPTFRPLSDTWTFDGTAWAQQSPAASPPALSD